MNDTPYDNALNALQASQAHIGAIIQRQHDSLGGISRFYDTLQEVRSGDEEIAARANAQIAAAYKSPDGEEEELQAEHDAVAALFARLDEADIRRMIDTFSHKSRSDSTIHLIFNMLACSRNLAAVEPLVERLEAPVIHREPPP